MPPDGAEGLAGLGIVEVPPRAYVSFGNYWMSEGGLFFIEKVPRDNDGQGDSGESIWLSSPFEVLAHTRDDEGNSWGKLLRWRDRDGREHEWPMPDRALGGVREEVWRQLLDGGLQIASSTSSRNKLADYLSGVSVKDRACAVERVGWHGWAFVLPDHVLWGSPESASFCKPRRALRYLTRWQARWRSGATQSATSVSATPALHSASRLPLRCRCSGSRERAAAAFIGKAIVRSVKPLFCGPRAVYGAAAG